MKTSKYVKHVDAFDNKFGNVLTGKIAKAYLGIKNMNIKRKEIEKFKTNRKYDIIYSFAIHHWIPLEFEDYIKKLKSLSKKEGIIFLESHNLNNKDKDFEKKKKIIKKYFEINREIDMKHDGNRICLVLKN